MEEVFVGWSGTIGKKVAESLVLGVLSVPSIKPLVSSLDIGAGRGWLSELDAILQRVSYAIICITPCTLSAPWLNFEAGIAYGRLHRIFVLTIGESVPPTHPFSTIQVLDGRKISDIKKLVRALLPNNESFADQWVSERGQAWINNCNEIIGNSGAFQTIGTLMESIQSATREIEANVGIFANPLFHFVVDQSINAISKQLNGVVGEYSVPSDLYPEYLAAMQLRYKPTVTAVALVDQEEFFWRGQLGKRILDTVPNKDCERIFVLSNSRQFVDFMPTLAVHAHKYQVHVLPYSLLMTEQPGFCHDFSIINAKGEKLLATYIDQGPHRRNIRFSTDTLSLNEHQEAFASIRALAVECRRFLNQLL